ncbi:MAG TPA: dihydropteroate synthase, partial [Helicobacteraceae bacterium]|nr:dihydropteroate synthase [Helicobacteraceae bacterium]
MHIEKLSRDTDMKRHIKALGVDGGGVKILSQKAQSSYFYIHQLHVGAANILKQDALSIGADLAVPKGTILAETPYVDAILIATHRQLEVLSKKELTQPFGLKNLAQMIASHLKGVQKSAPKIMGVLNANADSFYDKSRFNTATAVETITQMIEDGADIIDIGGVSSRPGSIGVSVEEELNRVSGIIEVIKNEKLYENVAFSLDTYQTKVADTALASGFKIINDITGLADTSLIKCVASYEGQAVLMHMQGNTKTMQENPHYDDVIHEVENFFEKRLESAYQHGLEDIILDVGIG